MQTENSNEKALTAIEILLWFGYEGSPERFVYWKSVSQVMALLRGEEITGIELYQWINLLVCS